MQEVSETANNEIEKRYKTAAFVVFGQIAFAILLVAVVWVIPLSVESKLEDNTQMTLWVGALFIAIGTFVIRRMLYRWERLKDVALLKGIKGLLQTLLTNSIILGAMAEGVVIIGFVISILSGNKFEVVRAFVIGLIVFFINFPRKSIWNKIAANLENI